MAGSSSKSWNDTPAGSAPETIYCFRHNDGEPFQLQKETGLTESMILVFSDLERILTNRVMQVAIKSAPATLLTQSFKSGDTKIKPKQQIQKQIFVCPRRDAVFLKCRDMSPDHNIRTILGISEDHQYPRIRIVCYRAEEYKQQRQRIRRGPHSDWKRASFKADDQSNENDVSARNKSTKMSWIDLREFQSENYRENHSDGDGSFLSTEAGVVQFLRSILTPSHDASPWEVDAKDEIENLRMLSPDMVVLVLNFSSNCGYEDDFSLLKNFRVSDAAPSWFLHGFLHLEALEQSLIEIFQKELSRDNTDRPIMASTSASTLLIYKKLGPRRLLHATKPALSSFNHGYMGVESVKFKTETTDEKKTRETSSNHTIVEKGCLWEEYEAKESNDDSRDQKEENNDSTVIESSKQTNSNKKNRRYRLVSPPYLNLDEEFPGANIFMKLFTKEALRVFTEDALSVAEWTPWPETSHYKVSAFGNEKPWTVFPLCHCFPANEPHNFTWIPSTKSFVPRTCRLLEEALSNGEGQSYLRTALFSQLAPRSVLEEHTGWADLANHVLRLHIPLVVPNNTGIAGNNDDLCGTWVDGCVETHAVGRPLLFDDSKIHRAFNYSDGDRIVLIVDLARPERLPLGTSESGHTEELDAFIEQIGLPK